MRNARLEALETRIVFQVLPGHRVEQVLPVLLPDADDRDVTVTRRINVVRRLREPAMAVAGAARVFPADAERHAELRAHRRIDRIEHRDLHRAAATGALAVEQCG